MANTLAYGFVGLDHMFAQRVSELRDIRVIDDAITASLAEHNRQVNELMNLAVTRTTAARERFRLPGAGTLQPLDEWGNPYPVRVGQYHDIGFPIRGGGTAWGTNRVSNALMTVQDANDFQVMVQSHDLSWLQRHITSALLNSEEYTWDDPEIGAITIYPLANGDETLFMRANGFAATANHYTAQAADIADETNPFPAIHTSLSGYPGNNGPFVSYIATDLRSDVVNLSTFVDVGDPDINVGMGTPTLARSAPGGVRAFGSEVLGKVDGMWIVEWPALPSGYILSFAQGAADSAIAMREYPTTALQGFIPETHSPDGNRLERRFIRYAGFAARNRTAAMVTQIGEATYETPAGLEAPLAV